MQIFNIGPLELIIVLLIMFLLLGPKEMILTAQRIGKWIRSFVRSPMWREIMGYSQEIRDLPQKIMDDTGLKETLADIKASTTQTTNELNTTVREAIADARVPEAENIRIQANPTSVPTSEPRQTWPNPVGQAAKDAAAAAVAEVAGSRTPAVVETALPAAPDTVSAEESSFAAGGVSDAEAPAAEMVLPVVEEAPKPRRGRPRKVDALVVEGQTPAEDAVTAGPRRARKTAPPPEPSETQTTGDSSLVAGAALPTEDVRANAALQPPAPTPDLAPMHVEETTILPPEAALADAMTMEKPARKPRKRTSVAAVDDILPEQNLPPREAFAAPTLPPEDPAASESKPARRPRKKAIQDGQETILDTSVLPASGTLAETSSTATSDLAAPASANTPVVPAPKPRKKKQTGNAAVYDTPEPTGPDAS